MIVRCKMKKMWGKYVYVALNEVTDLPALSDTLGTRVKCHCNQKL